MTVTLHSLPFAVADGPGNMAADEVLLELAAVRGSAWLRFYGWTEPTLSLGYFQPAADARILGQPMAWVRRPTGGAAIVHHHELTYALALPERATPAAPAAWICRIHRLLSEVLSESGVASRVVACGEERKLGPVLCFLHQTPGDLLIDGSKVAGSAQRKRRGALLQHGSILLGRTSHAPMLPGINDLAGEPRYTPELLAERLIRRLEAETGRAAMPEQWTPDLEERREKLRVTRYDTAAWNEKR
jgi:lipoate-protein ligase A